MREQGETVFRKCSRVSRKYEWANISKIYKRDISDYVQLCKSCHMLFDLTPEKVKALRKIAKERSNIPWNTGKVYGQEKVVCKNCSKSFQAYKSRKAKFCCQVCSSEYNSGNRHHMRRK
jgi:hypothetical protein